METWTFDDTLPDEHKAPAITFINPYNEQMRQNHLDQVEKENQERAEIAKLSLEEAEQRMNVYKPLHAASKVLLAEKGKELARVQQEWTAAFEDNRKARSMVDRLETQARRLRWEKATPGADRLAIYNSALDAVMKLAYRERRGARKMVQEYIVDRRTTEDLVCYAVRDESGVAARYVPAGKTEPAPPLMSINRNTGDITIQKRIAANLITDTTGCVVSWLKWYSSI